MRNGLGPIGPRPFLFCECVGAALVIARRLLQWYREKEGSGPTVRSQMKAFFAVQNYANLPNERFMKAFFAYFLSRKKVG